MINSILPLDTEVSHNDSLATLIAFNRAYGQEMREMFHTFPLQDGDCVIDIACGEGNTSFWLAENISKSGMVMAIDLSASRLATANANNSSANAVRFCRADTYQLPFRSGAFDVACCTHSLITLRNTKSFLSEVIRIVRLDGWIVLVENDSMHHVILPWPVELEVDLHTAIYRAHKARSSHPWMYYMGRYLPEMLASSGLQSVHARPWISNRAAPFDKNVLKHLICYLHDLRHYVAPYLPPQRLAEFDKLTQPDSDEFLLDRPGISVTIIDWMIVGKKPASPRHENSNSF